MIVRSAEEFLSVYSEEKFPADQPGVCKAAFLVTPVNFRLEEQSAQDNTYMDLSVAVDADYAMAQHRRVAERLMACGVNVFTFPGRADLPDGCFPNNAFATIDKKLVIGSMLHPARRGETARRDIRSLFETVLGYEEVDLSRQACVAELTGVMAIDRARGIGFCGMSQRVDDAGVEAMHKALGLKLTWRFDLHPDEYHLNVVMAVLASRACVVYPPAILADGLLDVLKTLYGDQVMVLSEREKNAFAANCISLTEHDLFMSTTSVIELSDAHRDQIDEWGFTLHGLAVDELEKAGGSLRCLIAEVY